MTVEVPTVLTARQRELLEELAKELGDEVQPQQKSFVQKLKEFFGIRAQTLPTSQETSRPDRTR